MSTAKLIIPQTQKAAVLEDFNQDYVLKTDHPVKQPSELLPGECLVKLEYSGVCHSDLHIKKADWSRKGNLPLIGGHEGIGHVVAIGDHSGQNVIKIGDRVGLKWIANICGRCEMCRKGHESSCPVSFQKTHGFMLHGTFQQYAVSFIDYVTPIPDGIDSAAATPILCAGMTVYKALKQANVSIGQWVAISGAGGGLGHLAVQYAVARGLRVLAIDTGETKKELVLSLGAEKWIDFKESGDDLIKDVQAATGGGPQAAIIAAGDPKPFNQALLYLRSTGTLVAVGMPAGSGLLNAPVPLLIAKSLTIKGSAIGSQQDVTEALQIAAMGKVECRHEVRELDELNNIFADMEAGKIAGRIVIKL
ncbi:mannitol-1-phosphate dehydrogenase M1PDH1 [Crucibulum laeve]|uniref:alcohol dehydrogenase n=1 Tax=Crucibulum laeve TaxID=68775 RepID=A0A5C3LQV8_9AGAR|nr:mannitol-1-phosphate dehydrogenase M1PDH1 [Crucibulum laeve]